MPPAALPFRAATRRLINIGILLVGLVLIAAGITLLAAYGNHGGGVILGLGIGVIFFVFVGFPFGKWVLNQLYKEPPDSQP